MLAIVAGYPDGNDCDVLRDDPAFKMALDRPPVSGPALCSQPTVSRIENMPRRSELYRMAEAMLDLYCDSFPVVPSHLTLDLDESFDRVHGEQELRKFNAYYDDWGFLPIHIFDTSGRLVVSVLREAATPSGREILTLVKRVVGHLRERFPRVRIRLRGDSHYACPEVMSWCEANGLEYIFGLSGNATLAAQVQTLEARTGGAICRAPRGRATQVQAPPLHGLPGRGQVLELPAPDRRPGRSRTRWGRHPLHRHQPDRPPGAAALRAKILPERPDGHLLTMMRLKPQLGTDRVRGSWI